MPQKEMRVLPAQEGATVLTLLRQAGLSTGLIRRLKRQNGLLLDGQPCFVTHRVSAGQRLTLLWQDAPAPAVRPVCLPLDVVYEDEDLLAVNKPAGMPVHPSAGHRDDTLANAFARAYPDLTFRPADRLDRYTTGLVVIAKTPMAAAELGRQMKAGQIQKVYLAVTHGVPDPPEGRIDAPIARAPDSVLKRRVDSHGKPSVTDYRLLKAGEGQALVELRPRTGRTHQIRVHMAHMGCPLAYDWLYGQEIQGKTFLLHCQELTFAHPATGEPLTLQAPAPDEFLRLR